MISGPLVEFLGVDVHAAVGVVVDGVVVLVCGADVARVDRPGGGLALGVDPVERQVALVGLAHGFFQPRRGVVPERDEWLASLDAEVRAGLGHEVGGEVGGHDGLLRFYGYLRPPARRSLAG